MRWIRVNGDTNTRGNLHSTSRKPTKPGSSKIDHQKVCVCVCARIFTSVELSTITRLASESSGPVSICIGSTVAFKIQTILTLLSAVYNQCGEHTTPWVKKRETRYSCPYLCYILIDFHNSFTDVLSWKFAIQLLIKIPPHLRYVATLPCEMLMFANSCIPSGNWKVQRIFLIYLF